MKLLVSIRRFSQVFFLLLFVYILWSTAYPLKGKLLPDTFFKADTLVMTFTAVSERVILPGIGIAVAMLLLTLLLGRFFYGWICPLGTMIDIAGQIRKKRGKAVHSLRFFKFIILACMAVLAFIGIQAVWIFDPIVVMTRFVALNLIPFTTWAVTNSMIFITKTFDLFGTDFYEIFRTLRQSLLGVKVYHFSNAMHIFYFFLFVLVTTFAYTRFWCRNICPLGALYAVIAKFSLLRRYVIKCAGCKRCISFCRMGAITNGVNYIKEECVLCMDCVYDCLSNETYFAFPFLRKKPEHVKLITEDKTGGVTRRQFLMLLGTSVFLPVFGKLGYALNRNLSSSIIRPPAAQKEEKFLNSCVRCGNCMKVCPTNGLQPVMMETGLQGIWTPKLVPEIGYCEYNCNLCGQSCPTGAITRLTIDSKRGVKLGCAEINKKTCIAWANNDQCIVCEEHCPVPAKAIKLMTENIGGKKVLKPYVVEDLCIGCGICQNKCPVSPVRAIRVNPVFADRK